MSRKVSFTEERVADAHKLRQAKFAAAIARLKARSGFTNALPIPAVAVCREIGIKPPSSCSRQWKPLFDQARKQGIIQTVNRKPRRGL